MNLAINATPAWRVHVVSEENPCRQLARSLLGFSLLRALLVRIKSVDASGVRANRSLANA